MYGEKNDTVRRLQGHIDQLKNSLDGRALSSLEALGPASVKIISQAERASRLRAKPGKENALFMAFVMSIFLSAVIVVLVDTMDTSFKSPYEVERTLHINYLGSIPKRRRHEAQLISLSKPHTRYSYAFQDIAEDIFILTKDRKIKSLIITDTRVSVSTSIVIMNLATILAEKMGQSVLVIDANIKAPTLAEILNLSNSPGLVDVVEGKQKIDDVIREIDENLYVITSGGRTYHTTAILECSKISSLISYAKDKFELVLVNYACLKQYCDAVILSSMADGALIVVNEGASRKKDLVDAVNFIKLKNINVIGAVMNDRKFVLPKMLYKIT
jgi:Mrp family chromosome partitioning ATPase